MRKEGREEGEFSVGWRPTSERKREKEVEIEVYEGGGCDERTQGLKGAKSRFLPHPGTTYAPIRTLTYFFTPFRSFVCTLTSAH